MGTPGGGPAADWPWAWQVAADDNLDHLTYDTKKKQTVRLYEDVATPPQTSNRIPGYGLSRRISLWLDTTQPTHSNSNVTGDS